ncbi:hypothetical protein [Saccharopolyspora karakumensis]|uniref:hypothetical protein n=1 Tax=Saccharopolyspora karakumensis TaxID=2530386 RepID=UPI001F3BF6C3|nr:hypothetical protein [Saccharopolyspora karakumensis]
MAIWENLNTHISRDAAVDRQPGLPPRHSATAYAPDLNPTESVWSNVKGSLAVTNVDHLATVVRNRLKRIQFRAHLLTGFLAQNRPHPRPGTS